MFVHEIQVTVPIPMPERVRSRAQVVSDPAGVVDRSRNWERVERKPLVPVGIPERRRAFRRFELACGTRPTVLRSACHVDQPRRHEHDHFIRIMFDLRLAVAIGRYPARAEPVPRRMVFHPVQRLRPLERHMQIPRAAGAGTVRNRERDALVGASGP